MSIDVIPEPTELPATQPTDSAVQPENPPKEQTATPEEEKPKAERTFTQAELDRILNRERAKESRRAERLAYERARADLLQQQITQREQPKQDSPERPTQQQFRDYESYIQAVARWEAKQELLGTLKEQEEARKQREAQTFAEREKTELQSRLSQAAEKYDDFEEVALNPNLPIHAATAAYIRGSDLGGEVSYFLGKNPREAERIYGLDPVAQWRELTKIETKLSAPPKPTKAPAPIKPVNTSQDGVSKDPSDMSYDEFVQWRRESLKKSGRR